MESIEIIDDEEVAEFIADATGFKVDDVLLFIELYNDFFMGKGLL